MKISALLLLSLYLQASTFAQTLSSDKITTLAHQQLPTAWSDFRSLLSLPNDAHYPKDIEPNIAWLDSAFQTRQFQTQRLSTKGEIPLLLAERQFAPSGKTVLIYLQADGQPVDPTRWNQPHPFTPVLKAQTEDGSWQELDWQQLAPEADYEDWRVFARSASDAKGPIIMFLAALDAMQQAGFTPNYNIKVVIDFEEELGSPHLPAAVKVHQEVLAADMLIIYDGPPHISNQPTLKFGARGIATITLTVYGPRVPQHSGHYGNYAPNPGFRLSHLLASMKNEDGRVTIPGFYDGIDLSADTKSTLQQVPDDEAAIQQKLGIAETDKVGATYQEALQYPSLNIRGLSSGWVAQRVRTIVPSTATAEIDIRLVMESDPERLIRLVREHVEQQGYYLVDSLPTDDERMKYPKIAFFRSQISYPAFRTKLDSEVGNWLSAALAHHFGENPIKIRTTGGSVPIAPFVNTLGIPAVIVPTVNPDNNQHSPNENLRLGNLTRGIETYLAILAQPLP
ncbi:M20/M25/M40 family metallo-hydrolase [Tunicatimonas pelagia]|uniref:M20/M25/M40 family metallo-hydrolase n=1 Tax=Tunicatimonas pelagia TaxID=931531 RepID=UPI002665EBA0|nr:M20/M25/M40 family metallo-hydrolase [Tunicatimonas pelagia]WKN42697.1 M20/M25/M40 family metallo-hydrolase [Tunicatimonas pelagia]